MARLRHITSFLDSEQWLSSWGRVPVEVVGGWVLLSGTIWPPHIVLTPLSFSREFLLSRDHPRESQ